MDASRIKQFCHALHIDCSTPDARGWVQARCPYAGWKHQGGVDKHPSFAIKVVPGGESHVNCFSCKSSGKLGEVVFDLKHHGYEADYATALQLIAQEEEDIAFPDFDEETLPEEAIYPFDEKWLATFPIASKSPTARTYLQSRNMSLTVCDDWDVRWDGIRRRVCWPIRNEYGMLTGFHGRAVDDDVELRYLAYGNADKKRNPHVLLGEHRITDARPVVLVEGPPDAVAVSAVYRNVLSLNGTALSHIRLARMEKYFEFIPLFDADKAGEIARKNLKKWAGKTRIVYPAHLPDERDPADLLPYEIVSILEEFVPAAQIFP
jgi:hypothetical protein